MGERPRGPGLLYAGIALVLLILVAALALTNRQPPPPSIAEFAPQAVEHNVSHDDPGVSNAGSTGRNSDAVATPAAIDAASVVDVPRVRRCVGDPPRQIEDPQSPPCVPYWAGDNGGATARGVTSDSIRVALPDIERAYQELVLKFFQSRFEFYGRKVQPTFLAPAYTVSCNQRKAQAVGIVQEQRAFATISWNSDNEACFIDEAARRGLLHFSWENYTDEPDARARAPYVWQYAMAFDRQTALEGRMICRLLAGQPARHGKGLTGTPPAPIAQTLRHFGAIVQDNGRDERLKLAPLQSELRACREEMDGDRIAYFESRSGTTDPQTSQNAIIRMQSAGVTSIMCLCGGFYALHLGRAASAQGYYPEWIFATYGGNDNHANLKVFFPNAEQRLGAFGLTVQPPHVPYDSQPAVWAARGVSPDFQPARAMGSQVSIYRGLLLMASGFQLAGPNLTAKSLERGMHRAAFPNPVTPLQAGNVGFQDGDHTMTDDAALFWWGESEPGPYPDDSPGTFCFVDGAARASDWPRAERDPFFSGPCSWPRG